MPHQRFRNVNNPDNHRGATLGDRKGPSETRPESLGQNSLHTLSPSLGQVHPGCPWVETPSLGSMEAPLHAVGRPPPHPGTSGGAVRSPGTPFSWAASDPSGGLVGRGNGNSDGWATVVLCMKLCPHPTRASAQLCQSESGDSLRARASELGRTRTKG